MKQKLLYIIFSFVVLTASTGFGFLESSTIMHGRENRMIKEDSLRNVANRIDFQQHTPTIKKEQDRPSNQLTKSVIQCIANAVRNTLALVVSLMLEVVKIVLMAIVKFLFN